MIHKSVMINNMAISDENSMVETLLSLLGHLGILTNTCDALTLTIIVASSPNHQEEQQDGLSNDNIQKKIKERLSFWKGDP